MISIFLLLLPIFMDETNKSAILFYYSVFNTNLTNGTQEIYNDYTIRISIHCHIIYLLWNRTQGKWKLL